MRVLVTGALGKVGRATVAAVQAAGDEVVGSDIVPATFGPARPGVAPYVRADLTDAGEMFALVGGFTDGESAPRGRFDAVVHAGALPAPGRHPAHVVFTNNLLGTFNVVEACVRWGVPRLVNISSETVLGFQFAERLWLPEYLQIDEDHPCRPQDPYGTAKLLGEQVCTAATRRSDITVLSLRPTWVQERTDYAPNLGPVVADPSAPSSNGWSYIDALDLADAIVLATRADSAGHEAMFLSAADTIGGRDLAASWRAAFPDSTTELRDLPRPDAAGIGSAKAQALLGWAPARSWRDYLDGSGQPTFAVAT